MTELFEWLDQYRSDLHKQSAERAALIEGLIFCSDYEAIQDWLKQWESEDAAPDSLAQKYRRTLEQLQSQRSLIIKGICHDCCR